MKLRELFREDFHLQPPSKIIIDTHGGIQDILAIIFAYKHLQLTGNKQQIIGITCVAGKNSLEKAVKSALVANKILGAKIPVFKGQRQSLLLKSQYPKSYLDQKFMHIEQNLYSQLQHEKAQWQGLVQKQKAVDFIIRACKQHAGNIGIVSFGPTTNIALAQRMGEMLDDVKTISLTGGQYMGLGNTLNGGTQPNFAHDPLAAHIILKHGQEQSFKNRIYVNVIEQTLSFCWKLAFNSCLDTGKLDPVIDDIFVNMMGINSIVLNCGPLLTILPLIQPKTVEKQYHVFGQIVRDGGHLDGLLAVNWLKVCANPQDYQSFMYIYQNYNKQLITQLFVNAFTHKIEQKLKKGNQKEHNKEQKDHKMSQK